MKATLCILLFLLSYTAFSQEELKILVERNSTLPNDTSKVNNLNKIAKLVASNQPEHAREFAKQALDLSLALSYNIGIAESYQNIGLSHDIEGEFIPAMENYRAALRIWEKEGNKLGIAHTETNIGNIHNYLDEYDKSLQCFEHALQLHTDLGNKDGISDMYNNIAITYFYQEKINEAEIYFKKSLAIYKETNNNLGIARAYNNLGGLYQTDLKLALEWFNKALELYRQINDKNGIGNTLLNIGNINADMQKFDLGIAQIEECLRIAGETNNLLLKKEAYSALSGMYEKTKNTDKALEYHKRFKEVTDSIFNIESDKRLMEINTIYETEKRERELAIKESESKRHKWQRNSTAVGLALVVLLALFIFRGYKIKQKDNKLLSEQNIKIAAQRDEIEQQKHIVVEKNRSITDSIQYAKRIQSAILPPTEVLRQFVTDFFIMFKPRDIVSGDFYWWSADGNKLYFAVADCTGHGVPGSLVSMLGMSLLNEIINKYEISQANELLNRLRDAVILSLHQTGKEDETKDGMDIALCIFDKKTMMLQYAGANNSVVIINIPENSTELTLTEYKPDKMPIGVHLRSDRPFANNEIQLRKGDKLYLFSDGINDQFDRENKHKFSRKRLKETMLRVYAQNMTEQKLILETTLAQWKGSTEQMDDITVFGMEV